MQSETSRLNKKNSFCNESYDLEKEIFITKCIEILRFKRFSYELIEGASEALAWNRNYYKILFNHGISDVAIEIEKMHDLVMNEVKFVDENGVNIGVTKKITKLLESRIINKEIPKSSVISMNSYYKSFSGACAKIKSSYNTVDMMWRLISDKSLDFSYYSKRMILFGLYEKAQHFYINKDDSENSNLTRRYIEEIVGKSVAKLSSIAKVFKKF